MPRDVTVNLMIDPVTNRVAIVGQPDKKPYCCPVCLGRGWVQAGFYGGFGGGMDCEPEKCRSCSGTGIVWHE